ncbi:MAG: GntR family transcriptional regulator [Actinomycetota bacterium]
MMLRVDHSSSQPLHDQIAGQLRAAIADGQLSAGERLAPARELAAGLDVNVNTLLRALQTLRAEGLVDMRRGRGTVVTGTAPQTVRFVQLAEQLVAEARRAGLSRQDVLRLVEDRL